MRLAFCCAKQASVPVSPLVHEITRRKQMRIEMYKHVLKCSLCKGRVSLLFTISDTNNARSKNVWRLSPVISYLVAADKITLTEKQTNSMSCTYIWQLISQD